MWEVGDLFEDIRLHVLPRFAVIQEQRGELRDIV